MDFYNQPKSGNVARKKLLTALVAAFAVLLAINVIMFAILTSTLKASLTGDMQRLEAQLDDRIDGAIAGRLTNEIADLVAAEITDEVTQTATLSVTQAVTEEVIENYKREYNLPENYSGIGVIAAAKVESVLELKTSGKDNPPYDNQTISAQSSAFVITTDGYAITNAHCVTFEAGIYKQSGWTVWKTGTETKVFSSIQANFKGSTQQYEMEVIAYNSPKDLAIIKFKNPPANLKPVVFGNSDLINLGEEVAAIGNAQGLGISLTTGVVSNPPQVYNDVKIIQTDTTINPGNSGGPLFNIYAEFIGVVSFKIIESELNEGLGFAIASNSVKAYIASVESQNNININYTAV